MVLDMHCDTISEILSEKRKGNKISLKQNNLHLDLLRMKQCGYLLQNFALWSDFDKCENPWNELFSLYGCYCEEIAKNTRLIAPIARFSDIEKNFKSGKMSAMLTVEDAGVLEGKTERLKTLYNMGVRMLTLTWNYPNEIGFPSTNYLNKNTGDYTAHTACGLTPTGRQVVEVMERLGIIIDVSHLSDAGFYDISECTKKPFVASHSNSRTVCNHPRNLTDDMLKILADRGGCVGLNFYPPFLFHNPKCEARDNILALINHAKHIKNVAGIDILSLGSDFDGFNATSNIMGVQSMPILWETFHNQGFTSNELDKVFFGNALRVYKDVLKP